MRLRWTIVAVVASLCAASAGKGAFSADSPSNAAAVASLADLARTVLARADGRALSPNDRRDLLAALYGLAGADAPRHTPETNAALGDTILRAAAEAQRGDHAFLSTLMMLVVSPYGRTAEGSEWINELLWEALAVQPQASIDSMAALPTDIRKTVMAEVYTAPVHDGFDFSAILESLARIRVPPGFDAETAAILETLHPLAR